MSIKKLPKGISNYEDLIEQGYCYVDKTKYIEKIEDLPDKTLMFLRPRNDFNAVLFRVFNNSRRRIWLSKTTNT